MWQIVPTKMSLAETILPSQLAVGFGALMWAVALWKLKGLEPESTDSFGGGPNEARLIGGACFGFVYFFPLAVWLVFVDIKFHSDSPKTALLSNFAFLVGSSIGAAIFYGSPIRRYVSGLNWSHLQQESVLVLAWSGLIVGAAFAFYTTVSASFSEASIPAALARGAFGSLISMLLCYLMVFIFISCCATSAQPRQDLRGIFVGMLMMWSITAAHEISRTTFTALLQSLFALLRKIS
jgi:hypothetical protein